MESVFVSCRNVLLLVCVFVDVKVCVYLVLCFH